MKNIRGRKRTAAGGGSTGISPRPMLMGAAHDALWASNARVSLSCPWVIASQGATPGLRPGVSRSSVTGAPSCGLETVSWRTGRPAQHGQIVSVCLMLRRRPPSGLSLSRSPKAPRGKGRNTRRLALGQFRSKPRIEMISFVSSRRRRSSSTWDRGKPFSS